MAAIAYRGGHQWQPSVRRKGHPPVRKTFEAEAKRWGWLSEPKVERGAHVSPEEAQSASFAEALARCANELRARRAPVGSATVSSS